MILKFFDIFLKMKDLTSSEAFMVRKITSFNFPVYSITLFSIFWPIYILYYISFDAKVYKGKEMINNFFYVYVVLYMMSYE